MKTKQLKAVRIAAAIVIVLAALVASFFWYVHDFYPADEAALAVAADSDGAIDGVVVHELSNKAIAFVPDHPIAGFIFYPGGKVQPEAYAPLMKACADRGILCILVKPLFNLAILEPGIANGLQAQFPDIDTWLIGGHSLGGVAMSDYLNDHMDDFEGVVYLASYPNVDLTGFEGGAISLVGTNDQVINLSDYRAAQSRLPVDAKASDIEGGNHSQFGNYGQQAGDGEATITHEEQQAQTADAIAALAKAA